MMTTRCHDGTTAGYHDSICALRLTCRAFHESATPHLFRAVRVCYISSAHQKRKSASTLTCIARSPVARYVTQLTLQPAPNSANCLQTDSIRTDLVELGSALLSNVDAFRCLNVLRVQACTHSMRWQHSRDCLDALRTEFTRTIGETLGALAQSCLRTLELNMSLAHDFSELALYIPTSLLSVHTLSLGILDQSGEGGSAYVFEAATSLQTAHPNSDSAGAVIDFIRRFPNLSAVTVKATHYLDMDELASLPLHRIQHLQFRRVTFSAVGLIQILSLCQELDDLILDECELRSGDWGAVFHSFTNHLSLTAVRLNELGYATKPRSFSLSRPRPCFGSGLQQISATDRQSLEVARARLGSRCVAF